MTKHSGISSKKYSKSKINSKTNYKTNSKTNSKTKKKCWDYDVNSKSSYEELFKALHQCGIENDWEVTHSIEDDILHKFLIEIMNNKYKTKKEITTYARMIFDNTLKKKYKKWYA